MTDPDPSPDELVSAHLDGEATAEEAARVDEDPALQARLERFASVRDAVRAEVPSLPDDERDALLARVMGTAIAPPKVVSLDSRRRMTTRVITVAAAIIAIAFLGGALAMIDGRSDGPGDDSASSAESSATTLASGGEGSVADSAFSAPSAETSTGGAMAYATLGSFADAEALRDAVEQLQPADAGADQDEGPVTNDDAGSPPTTAPSGGTSEDQATRAAATACLLRPGVLYTADIAGRPVVVVVDATTVYVSDANSCATVATFAR